MTSMRWPVAVLVCCLLIACGKQTPAEPEADEAAASEPEQSVAAATPPPSNPTTAPLSVEDIERWALGLAAERQAVTEAAAQLATAQDDTAKLEALHATTEQGTLDAGAAAAGLDRDRYRYVRSTLSGAVSQLTPLEEEMDVSTMGADMVKQMEEARAAGVSQLASELPPEVLEALRARAIELRRLDKTIVGERLKVAMQAR